MLIIQSSHSNLAHVFSSKSSSSICAGMSGCRSNNFSTSSYLYLNGFLHKPNNDPKQVMNHFHLKWFAIFLVEISTFSMFFLIGSAMLLSFTQSNSLWERLKMYTHTHMYKMYANKYDIHIFKTYWSNDMHLFLLTSLTLLLYTTSGHAKGSCLCCIRQANQGVMQRLLPASAAANALTWFPNPILVFSPVKMLS